jgi:hypothetical protein
VPAEPEDGVARDSRWPAQRVRARNLIRRWARALADPRDVCVAIDAPAVNYTALIDLLSLIWLGDGLHNDTMRAARGGLGGLLGGAGRKGLFDVADDELRDVLVADISDDTRHLGAGLAYVALHNDMPASMPARAWTGRPDGPSL